MLPDPDGCRDDAISTLRDISTLLGTTKKMIREKKVGGAFLCVKFLKMALNE